MSVMIEISKLRELYHAILEEEARRICDIPLNQGISGKLCFLSKTQYYLTYDDLRNVAVRIGFQGSSADKYINELISRGFLIRLNGRNAFRSYHFDFLLRASDLRTAPWTNKMTAEVKFIVGLQEFEDPKQASLLPNPNGEEIERELYNILNSELGHLAGLYVKIISDYLKLRGSRGYTYFQMKALLETLKNFRDFKVIAIGAPAGFGKTEIFLGILLFKLLKDLKERRRSRVLVVYPRKFLEIDQAYRLIEFVRIVNESLYNIKYSLSIAIRDGDSYKIEEQVNDCRKYSNICNDVMFRGIRCSQEGTLYINVRTEAVICKEGSSIRNYDFVKWSRCDSKNTEIIITNLYTLFNRIIAVAGHDLDARDLVASNLPLEMIILDEAHEYEPVELGLLHYIIKFVDRKKGGKPVKLVISTATLANMKEFARSLRGASEKEVLVITYDDVVEQEREKIEKLKVKGRLVTAKKFVILGIIFVHPMFSWETYTAYLSTLSLFTNFVLETVLGAKAVKQTIVFLNNVKELNRLYTIVENELNLGTPIDFTGFTIEKLFSDLDPIVNRYSLKHYSDILEQCAGANKRIATIVNNIKNRQQMREELFPKLAKVFAEVDLEKRREIALKMQRKELYTVIATSSLELGVDYPGVTVIVNIGLDKVPSLIQRIGRAGRSPEESLNTVLALLIVRNNPVEYVRVFKLLNSSSLGALIIGRLKGINEKEIIDELTVSTGEYLVGVKKLATSRLLFAFNALDPAFQHLHGLNTIKGMHYRDECFKLIELRKALQKYENDIKVIVGEKAVNTLIQEVLKHTDVQSCIDELQREEEIESLVDSVTTVIEDVDYLCKSIPNLHSKGVSNVEALTKTCRGLCNKYKDKISILSAELLAVNKEQKLKEILQELNEEFKGYCQALWNAVRQVQSVDNEIVTILERCYKLYDKIRDLGLKK
uniref:DEAD/DEAH box helicase n=1 Tax=Ignisphaera aggregans TaxID=334771 RepID=A0A7J2TCD6_9CREN